MATSTRQLETRIISLTDQAAKITTITDQCTYDRADECLKMVKALRAQIEEELGTVRDKARAAWQAALDLIKRHDGPLAQAELRLKGLLVGFEQARRQKDEAKRRAIEAAARAEADEAAAAAAAVARASGAAESEVREILDAPKFMPAPAVAPSFQKAAGSTTRDNWSAEVMDFAALVQACCLKCGNVALIDLLEVNQAQLNARARAQKQYLKIPGVKAVNKPVYATKRF